MTITNFTDKEIIEADEDSHQGYCNISLTDQIWDIEGD